MTGVYPMCYCVHNVIIGFILGSGASKANGWNNPEWPDYYVGLPKIFKIVKISEQNL